MHPSQTYHQYTDFDLEPGGIRKLDFIVSEIQAVFPKHAKLRVLDVGCGSGNLSRPLASLGYDVIAIDEDRRAIQALRQHEILGNLQTVVSSLESFKDEGFFNVIVLSEILEHLEDPPPALRKMSRLLQDDGVLILTVPNGWTLEEIVRRILGSHPFLTAIKRKLKSKMKSPDIQSPSESPHLHFWTFRQVRSLLESSGFWVETAVASASFLKEWYYLCGRFFIRRGSPIFHSLDALDSLLVSIAPMFLASGWIMVLRKRKE